MSMTSEVRAPIGHPDKIFIGGEWVAPSSDSTIDVIDPATEELYFRAAEAQAPDVARAVSAARTAFDEGPWPRLTHAERAEYLRAFAAGLTERADDLGEIWPRQSGVLHKIAKWSGMGAAGTFSTYAALADTFPFEEQRTPTAGGELRPARARAGRRRRRDHPVERARSALICHKIGPALLAGCTVVLKSSPEAPGEGYVVAEVAEQIGLPPGVLNVRHRRPRGVGAARSRPAASTRSPSPDRPPRAAASRRSAASASPAARSSSAGSRPR